MVLDVGAHVAMHALVSTIAAGTTALNARCGCRATPTTPTNWTVRRANERTQTGRRCHIEWLSVRHTFGRDARQQRRFRPTALLIQAVVTIHLETFQPLVGRGPADANSRHNGASFSPLVALLINSIFKLIVRRSFQGMSACQLSRRQNCQRCPGIKVSTMSWHRTQVQDNTSLTLSTG